MAMVIWVMGVSGSGKTTLGSNLAAHVGLPFYDADDYHPPSNVQKMQQGIALNDDDRWPWLHALNEVAMVAARARGAIIACSALKQAYRQALTQGLPVVQWIYLQGGYETLLERMQLRTHHFMPPGLLPSQLKVLEEPAEAIIVPIHLSPVEQLQMVLSQLRLLPAL
ncbi:MAG TPA: gluconokinase [Phnomibacter sp.]|nr:gluconokinase [Phnomibacter sp.]